MPDPTQIPRVIHEARVHDIGELQAAIRRAFSAASEHGFGAREVLIPGGLTLLVTHKLGSKCAHITLEGARRG